MRFKVKGLGFEVKGLGFEVKGLYENDRTRCIAKITDKFMTKLAIKESLQTDRDQNQAVKFLVLGKRPL